MTDVTIIDVTADHTPLVIKLANTLREADRAELEAHGHGIPAMALLGALGGEVCKMAIDPEGNPIVMWGVSKDARREGLGHVWLMASDLIRNHIRQLLKEAPIYLAEMHTVAPLLVNDVDARNTLHIEWLKRLGFSFLAKRPLYGIGTQEFIKIVRLDV
jgi:ribosomal protein S18 acetylase RimI-like enzyme